jgi:hypothetical protein
MMVSSRGDWGAARGQALPALEEAAIATAACTLFDLRLRATEVQGGHAHQGVAVHG